MLDVVGVAVGVASFAFVGIALWRFAFWKGRRALGWRPLGLWLVCAVAASVLLEDNSPEAKASREAIAAEAQKASLMSEAESFGAKTLAAYVEMDTEARADAIRALVLGRGLPSDDDELFVSCMGEYASSKSPDLTISDVFGWCETERTNAPEKFAAHFNELDAPDYSAKASVICRNIVEGHLLSPTSADFPWVDDQVIGAGRHEYSIASHVDSENGFGAMLRSRYFCSVKYKGGDAEPLLPGSWDIISFEIE